MAFTIGAIAAKDGGSTSIGGGMLAADTSGGGAGPWFLYQGLVDGVAGSNKAAVTLGNALKVDGSAATQPVSLAAGAAAIAKAEDVASADADVGVPSMMVRKATPANTSGTDGDYEFLQGSAGRLWVDASGVTLTVASHAVTLAAGAAAIAKAEDVASADADVGVPAMAVRKATPANSSGTDGDYEMLQMSAGRLWTSGLVDPITPASWALGAFAAAMPANGQGIGLYDGTNMVRAKGDETSGIWVNVKAGAGSGGTAIADEAAFTEGTTNLTPIGGVYKTSHTALTTGQAGAVALSAAREMMGLSKLWDGTNTAAVKAASTAPVATDPAIVVAISPNSVNVNGAALSSASAPVVPSTDWVGTTALNNFGAGEWEIVAASQSNQILGTTGAVGDYLGGLLVVPSSTSPGSVTITDGSNSPDIAITVFAGGASSLSNLVPFFIPLGIKSLTGGWRVTTGANLSLIGCGNFT